MNIKKKLRSYISLKQQQEREQDFVRELNSQIVYGQTMLKGLPGAKSWDKDKLGKTAAKLVDLEKKHIKTYEAITAEIIKLDTWYEDLPESVYKTALYYRYFKGMSWVPIQHKLGNHKTADALRVGVNNLIATNSMHYGK